MALSGTEADIINSVARLRKATRGEIRRQVGFTLGYVEFLCQYLIRKGYLDFFKGNYSLTKKGIKTLLREESPKIDRELLREVAVEVAKEVSEQLKKTVRGMKIPVTRLREKAKTLSEESIKIKTDFDFPVEDESLALESNIDKIGVNLEKEKSDIDKSVELFRKIQKRRKK